MDEGTLKALHAYKGAAISYFWTGSGITNAPDATGFKDGILGANSDGISTGAIYHVVDGVWIATGATVANLYGA